MSTIRTFPVLVCLLSACGAVTTNGDDDDDDDAPDGGGGDDVTPPAISQATPAAGAVRVSVLTPIELIFDEPLDPASVNPMTISLTDAAGILQLPIEVAYDDAEHRVSVQPRRPLANGRWVVHVDGVADPAGNLASTTTSFTTVWNQDLAHSAYAPGLITGDRAQLGTDGLPVFRDFYTGVGADLVFETPDDPIGSYHAYTHDPSGHLLTRVIYDGPGPDAWHMGIDDVQSLSRYYYENLVLVEIGHWSDVGADGMPFTADDVRSSRTVYENDDAGRWRRKTIYTAPGPDGIWTTADDVGNWGALTGWTDTGAPLYYHYLDGPGPDGDWVTDDDHIAWSHAYEYTADRVRLTYTEAGGALAWYRDTSLGADGRPLDERNTTGPGTDAVWFTADDVVSDRTTWEYDGNGLEVREIRYSGAGADATWATADDVILDTRATMRDAAGAVATVQRMRDPGADGIWFTADDLRGDDWRHDTQR